MKFIFTIIKWFVLITSMFVIFSFTNNSRNNKIATLNNIEIDYTKFRIIIRFDLKKA